MKTVKLLVSSLLIFIAITISGDLFQDYLRHFEYTFDHTSFNLPFKVNGKEMTYELLEEAEKNNIRFFTVQRKSNGISEEKLYIYCSDLSVMNDIEAECNIKQQTHNSVFFGKTIVTAEPFENSSEEFLSGTYYLLGSSNDKLNFKMALMEKYGGGLVNDGYNPMNDQALVIALWSAVLAVFILLSLFEYSIKQKENALLVSLGINPTKLILKNIFIDITAILGSYILTRVIMAEFTSPVFCQSYHFLFITLIIIVDILTYLRLNRLKIQQIFKGDKSQKGVLASCYITKYIVTALTMALVASNLILIAEAVSWSSQETYWKEYYSYNQLSARYIKDNGNYTASYAADLETNYNAYSYYFNKADVILMSHIADEDFFGQDVIAYNQNSFEYLSESLDSIDFSVLEENTVYAFLPAKYFQDKFDVSQKEELDRMANYLIDWDGNYNGGAKIIYYNQNVKLLALNRNSDFESKYYKNPIILYVNIDEEKYPRINTGDDNIGSNTYFTIYNISSDEFKNFFERSCPDGYTVQVFSSNVGDQYQYKLGVAQKTLYINSFLTIFFMILNILITFVTVRLDYSVNAIELSLKKIMGFSLFSRQKKLLIGSGICSLISLIAAIIISKIMQLAAFPYLTLSGFAFLLIDLLVIIIAMKKTERERITKILKGGAL